MNNRTTTDNRVMRSALALKAYFERKLNTSIELLREAPLATRPGDLRLSEGFHAFDLWGVRPGMSLEPDVYGQVGDMFHAILGAVEELEQRQRILAAHAGLNFEGLTNVIPLHRSRRAPAYTSGSSSEGTKRRQLKMDCLIEGVYITEIHKMALELHSHSSRYAFLEYRDLDPAQRLHARELLTLGSITLFVPEMQLLSSAEQTALRELVRHPIFDRPLLMVGTTLPFSELRAFPGINLELLGHLARTYIKLTRPFAEYKGQGLIQYFLDSLSESPT